MSASVHAGLAEKIEAHAGSYEQPVQVLGALIFFWMVGFGLLAVSPSLGQLGLRCDIHRRLAFRGQQRFSAARSAAGR